MLQYNRIGCFGALIMSRRVVIAFIGEKTSGKTKLVERLVCGPNDYDDQYEPTEGTSIIFKKRNTTEMTLVDHSLDLDKETFLEKTAVVAIIIDLSKEISEQNIIDYINKITSKCAHKIQIALVGTKKDCATEENITKFNQLHIDGIEKKYIVSAKTDTQVQIDRFTTSIVHLGLKGTALDALDKLAKIKAYIETEDFQVGSYWLFQGGTNIRIDGQSKRVPHRVAAIYQHIIASEQIRTRPGTNPSRNHSRILKTLEQVQEIADKAIKHPRPGRKLGTTDFYNAIINGQFDFTQQHTMHTLTAR